MKLRVSLIDYLNAAPLGWAFLHGPLRGEFTVVLAPPSRCADLLAAGEVDIGLIPSIEYQRIPGLGIVPGVAIAAVDAVRSVVLVRRRGRPIRSIALDTSSRTSAVLVRLLAIHAMGLKPDFVPHPPHLNAMLSDCDAALLIGDAALRLADRDFEVIDLAQEWIRWQRLPFVFAVWAASPALDADVAGLLQGAKRWGLERRSEIAELYARKLALPADSLLDYLSNNIGYDLETKHVEGLARFYQLSGSLLGQSTPEPIRFLEAPRAREGE